MSLRRGYGGRHTSKNLFPKAFPLTAIQSSAGVSPVASFNYAYNSANQRTLVTNVDNSHWNYQYDFLGQVTSGKRYWPDGTLVAGQQFTYGFDDIGNRTNTASGGDSSGANLRSANYTNNVLNQITSRDVPGYVDVLGSANANATVTVNLQRAYRYGSYFQDELSENNSSSALYVALTNLAVLNNGTNADIVATNIGNVFLPMTPETFGYDNDGNMTNSGRWTITWDAENRATSFASVSSVPTAAKKKIDCAYDYQGRRIQKIFSTNNGSIYVAQSTNRFVYDGWNLVGILDGGNNRLYSFVWDSGANGLISMTVYSGTNAGTYFYCYDGNYIVVALVNAATGTIGAQYDYDPFLGIIRASGALASTNPFLGSTKFYDRETGLYCYDYRYYDPILGRWLSRDPIEESGGVNVYGFVANDPLDYTDPAGLALYAFDGTGNVPSQRDNVRILWETYSGGSKPYIKGVGDQGWKIFGSAFGAGGRSRLEWMWGQFLKIYASDTNVDIIGFSRGAAGLGKATGMNLAVLLWNISGMPDAVRERRLGRCQRIFNIRIILHRTITAIIFPITLIPIHRGILIMSGMGKTLVLFGLEQWSDNN